MRPASNHLLFVDTKEGFFSGISIATRAAQVSLLDVARRHVPRNEHAVIIALGSSYLFQRCYILTRSSAKQLEEAWLARDPIELVLCGL